MSLLPDNADNRTLRAAAFLLQTLEIDDEARVVAAEMIELKSESNAAIYTAEFDSSVGPAAFLVYVYTLGTVDDDGRSGREHFETDRETLETAAEREAPGPRIMAHALTADEGFILATTPATYRTLTGQAPPPDAEAIAETNSPSTDTSEIRRTAASDLLQLLRAADAQAANWLATLQTEGRLPVSSGPGDALADQIPFNAEETELALFLLDERSIQNLLRALNLLLTAARQQAADALGDPPVA